MRLDQNVHGWVMLNAALKDAVKRLTPWVAQAVAEADAEMRRRVLAVYDDPEILCPLTTHRRR